MSRLLWVMVVAIVVLGFIVLPERSSTPPPRMAAAATTTVRDGVLDAGTGYVVALDDQGRVFGWGGYDVNDGAKLVARTKRPRLLLAGSGYRRVAAGNRAVYVIDSESVLRRAALGDLAGDELVNPVPIVTAKRWRMARESWGVAAGIDRNGALWWWSDDEVAEQLQGRQPEPVAEPQPLMPGYRFVDACMQGPRLHAIDDQGRLWRSADLQRRGPVERPLQTEDGMLVRIAADTELTKLACRENAAHVLALARDGSVWGYGPNSFGELGVGQQEMHYDRAVLDATNLVRIADGPFVAVAVAPQVSLAIAADGSLWGWGRNLDNELGAGDSGPHAGPVEVDRTRSRIAIASTYGTGVAMDVDGRLQAWGSNAYGALGDGGIATTHDRPADVLTDIRFGGNP